MFCHLQAQEALSPVRDTLRKGFGVVPRQQVGIGQEDGLQLHLASGLEGGS